MNIKSLNCVYDELLRFNRNFVQKYKIANKSEFEPICKIMDSLGVKVNQKRQFFEQYYVPDLIGSECEILFILESPHTDEIIHKHPLSGDSGLKLSKELAQVGFDEIQNKHGCFMPFGCWLQENIDTDFGKKIGIINVCNFPIQIGAYLDKDGKLLKCSKILRSGKECIEFNNVIKNDFAERLTQVNNSKTEIIACGKYASKILDHYNVIYKEITHPSPQGLNTRSVEKKMCDRSVLYDLRDLMK